MDIVAFKEPNKREKPFSPKSPMNEEVKTLKKLKMNDPSISFMEPTFAERIRFIHLFRQ
jgi:hypothetical protein